MATLPPKKRRRRRPSIPPAPTTALPTAAEVRAHDIREMLTSDLLEALSQSVTRTMLQTLLVNITKQRTTETIDLFSAGNRLLPHLTVAGISPTQIHLVRKWVTDIVCPQLILAYSR